MTTGSITNTPDTTQSTNNQTKTPWKLGDPSSFQELFTSNLAATPAPAPAPKAASVATPISVAPTVEAAVAPPVAFASPAVISAPANSTPVVNAAVTSSLPEPTYEQGAFVVGPDGKTTAMNPLELATTKTANDIAAKLGGTVTGQNFAGGYSTSASIREITFANSKVQINAGLAASLFATYGDGAGSQAWQIINRDLGRDPLATGPVS